MKFMENFRYFSHDGYELYIVSRNDVTHTGKNAGKPNPRIRAEFGFGKPRYYKVMTDESGLEFAVVNGHMFYASR